MESRNESELGRIGDLVLENLEASRGGAWSYSPHVAPFWIRSNWHVRPGILRQLSHHCLQLLVHSTSWNLHSFWSYSYLPHIITNLTNMPLFPTCSPWALSLSLAVQTTLLYTSWYVSKRRETNSIWPYKLTNTCCIKHFANQSIDNYHPLHPECKDIAGNQSSD